MPWGAPRAVIFLSIALPFASAQNPGAVVINEILFQPDPASGDVLRTHPWLELFNKGTDPVDLSGWMVTARDRPASASARSLAGGVLPGGAYLLVYFASG